MRILVTGAVGLTGSHIAATLVRDGHEVVGVVRRTAQFELVPFGVRPALADCEDSSAMAPLIAGADALIHVAGITALSGIVGTSSIRRPTCVIVVSSAGVYSRHRRSAAAYRAGEDQIRTCRPDAIIVRPTMIYGSPRDRNVHYVINAARRFRFLPLFSGGHARLQPIHFADLAAAVVALVGRAATSPIDAGGGGPVSLRQAGDLIFEALGMPARYLPIPLPLAVTLARPLGRPRLLERILRMNEDRTVDNAKLVAHTGVRPRDFSTGVRDEVAAMLAPERG